MDLFKQYYFKNEARLKGHVFKIGKQDDYQPQFVSQAKSDKSRIV